VPDVSFTGLVVVVAVAFVVPLVLGLIPRFPLPAVVLEIVAGIVIGPSVLGWVKLDLPLEILSVIGLAFLLFLAGLEIEVERFRGRFLQKAVFALAASFGLSLLAGYGLHGVGLVESPLFVSIVLISTALGLVIPLLRDAGESSSVFGQLAIAGAALADFGAVILLSLFFSRESTGAGAQLALLGGFLLVVAAVGLSIARAGHVGRISAVLTRLQDTTAQIRVRGAVLLFVGVVALAENLGLEVILGAFLAGAILKLVDPNVMKTHPHFPLKLDALGFGFLVPIFFITSGVRFDTEALFSDASTILRVPVLLVALLVVRGAPAFFYRGEIGKHRAIAAGFLQATSLPFIVAASQIGMEIGVIGRATGAALVATGLLSVLIFPPVALSMLRRAPGDEDAEQKAHVAPSTTFSA
jgi:Kef-type K+ transport system membrane component KefB